MKETGMKDSDLIEVDIEVEAVALEGEDLSNLEIGYLDQQHAIIAKKKGT